MSPHQHKQAYTQREGFAIDYGREIENEIAILQEGISKHSHIESQYPARWLAIKLLEGDSDIKMRLQVLEGGKEILALAEKSIAHLEEIYGVDADVIIADHHYGWINGLVKETVKRTREDRLTGSDKIDQIVTHRLLGIPIFLLAMWAVFKLTADVSAPYLD
ncbi:MAG TPA: ferrous iron transporter B, partial [Anaerolineales bacterium]|nr:ferrous iron transporter B [Anaerolineales bacterium]